MSGPAFDIFIQDLIAPNIERLGFEFPEGEDYLTSLLQTLVFEHGVNCNFPSVMEYSKDQFQKWKTGEKTAIHPRIKGDVFKTVIRFTTGTELKKAYDAIFNEIVEETTADSKEAALYHLGRVKELEYIDRALTYFLSPDFRA